MIEIELQLTLLIQIRSAVGTLFMLQYFQWTNWIQCSVGSLLFLWPLCHSIPVLGVFFARSLPSAICDLPFAWLAKAIRKCNSHCTDTCDKRSWEGAGGWRGRSKLLSHGREEKKRDRQIQLTLSKSNQWRINAKCHTIRVILVCKFKRNI